MSPIRVGWIEVLRKPYGETIYAQMARTALSSCCEIEVLNVGFEKYKKFLYPGILWRLSRIKGNKDIWIRNFDSILTLPLNQTVGKNIALIHHIDSASQPFYQKWVFYGLEEIFYRNLKQVDAIVTVSQYWRNYFQKLGFSPVYLIYNGFDIEKFRFEERDTLSFKRRFNLEGKPILYIGNCQRIKGVVEVYESLKGLDCFFVTSGWRDVNLSTLHLNLDYKDYLLLLKSSHVVITMSKFKEGWNRTAHEAMLCKTPVIGSGLGGMRELLEGGRQLICETLTDLKELVKYAMEHPELGQWGYEFAKQFSREKFNKEWVNLIKRIYETEKE